MGTGSPGLLRSPTDLGLKTFVRKKDEAPLQPLPKQPCIVTTPGPVSSQLSRLAACTGSDSASSRALGPSLGQR